MVQLSQDFAVVHGFVPLSAWFGSGMGGTGWLTFAAVIVSDTHSFILHLSSRFLSLSPPPLSVFSFSPISLTHTLSLSLSPSSHCPSFPHLIHRQLHDDPSFPSLRPPLPLLPLLCPLPSFLPSFPSPSRYLFLFISFSPFLFSITFPSILRLCLCLLPLLFLVFYLLPAHSTLLSASPTTLIPFCQPVVLIFLFPIPSTAIHST